MGFSLSLNAELIGTGVRDSCGNASPMETPQESPGPPAESECLQWKETVKFYKPKKKLSTHSIIIELIYSLAEAPAGSRSF
ncbi:hypothetical protein CN563_02145 [Bacillus sp. AFS026049]|nr:hypothetical protein CN563_02145 [Bacillus sp. AFS026049]